MYAILDANVVHEVFRMERMMRESNYSDGSTVDQGV